MAVMLSVRNKFAGNCCCSACKHEPEATFFILASACNQANAVDFIQFASTFLLYAVLLFTVVKEGNVLLLCVFFS